MAAQVQGAVGRGAYCSQPVGALRPSTGTWCREGRALRPAVLGSQGCRVRQAVRRERGTEAEPAVLSGQGLSSAAVRPTSSRRFPRVLLLPVIGMHWGDR